MQHVEERRAGHSRGALLSVCRKYCEEALVARMTIFLLGFLTLTITLGVLATLPPG